jgi:hypothetical protein
MHLKSVPIYIGIMRKITFRYRITYFEIGSKEFVSKYDNMIEVTPPNPLLI